MSRAAVTLAAALAAAACGPDDRPAGAPTDPEGPYVITAVDYHFHDAHPTVRLAPGREVVVSNQGWNLHNVTIEGTDLARDVRPGERLSLGPIGNVLHGPGRHRFACKYHADRGMSGVIVVAG